MSNNIVLIGFMGVGKGQVGRALAEQTSMFAVDCDDLIESAANMKIRKMFKNFGEDYFRKKERDVAEWLQNCVSDTVVSTGGGFVHVPNLKEIGTVIYLHADFDRIIDSIMEHPNAAKKIKKRPLLQNLKKAKKLYDSRLKPYRKAADHTVDMNTGNIGKAVTQIRKMCGV